MVKVGIDTLAVYTPRYFLPLNTLALARGVDPNKYHVGLGQYEMSVPAPGEDIVTMAANAGLKAIANVNKENIAMVLFATESGMDQSKAAGIYVHDLLGLPKQCRVVELKQACYSGTAAIQLALPFLQLNPNKKVLVIASDIARYGLGAVGESSQGAGAVAMVLSANPRILSIEPDYAVMNDNVMDFWRPNYLDEALVEGKYSSRLYLAMLEKTWRDYSTNSGRGFDDHAYYCYHTPVPRLVEKAHQSLLKLNEQKHVSKNEACGQVKDALDYGRKIGNSYSAALYIGLASLLDNVNKNLAEQRIGFYSYGSGCVAEFFSGVVTAGYEKTIHTAYHQALISSRKELSYEEYEKYYTFTYTEAGDEQVMPIFNTGAFRLTHIENHKRHYQVVEAASVTPLFADDVTDCAKAG